MRGCQQLVHDMDFPHAREVRSCTSSLSRVTIARSPPPVECPRIDGGCGATIISGKSWARCPRCTARRVGVGYRQPILVRWLACTPRWYIRIQRPAAHRHTYRWSIVELRRAVSAVLNDRVIRACRASTSRCGARRRLSTMPVSWADELTTGSLPLYLSTRERRAKVRFLSGRQSHPARVRSNW